MLILVDTPTVEVRPGRGFVYTTLPYGIILTEANIVTAVSYTHLDVYKRQVWCSATLKTPPLPLAM